MYEEHDTDARTHATDPNGIGASPTRSSGRGFGIYHSVFVTMKKSYVRHHRILWHTFYFSPPAPEPRRRFGTTRLAPAALYFSVSLWISPNLLAENPGAIACGKPQCFAHFRNLASEDDIPGLLTRPQILGFLANLGARVFHRPGLVWKFSLESGIADGGLGVKTLPESNIMSRVDDKCNVGFDHSQGEVWVSRLLNISGNGSQSKEPVWSRLAPT